MHKCQSKDLDRLCFYIVLNTERGYPSVKFYEANGFKADESLVFMAADV